MELEEYLRALIGDHMLTLVDEEPAFRFSLEEYAGLAEHIQEFPDGLKDEVG